MSDGKYFRNLVIVFFVFCAIYVLLLFPERDPGLKASSAEPSRKQPFVWDQDAYWKALEEKYRASLQDGCAGIGRTVDSRVIEANRLLQEMDKKNLAPDAAEFGRLEQLMFGMVPLVGACRMNVPEYIGFAEGMRAAVKRQSEHWDMTSDAARVTLYRLLYGSRGAVEEIMMQMPAGLLPALTPGTDEPSGTPAAKVRNVILHSGDILVSRGGAPTSALIARGNDYPGNFSHIAFVYVDPETLEAKIVESHIEVGVVASTVEQYLADKKLRVMLLRLRADIPRMQADPMLPHRAAAYAYMRATESHVPYDFAMDYKDHSKLFCSEVASEAYERYGFHLWAGISYISSPGLRKWLAAFGVRHFETQEPSDLEYDPQLRVVAEWRDPSTLKKDRFDNAVTEVMIEGAEEGDELSYEWYLLPLARIAKAYSVLMNHFGKAGPVPEGMTATAALRTQDYTEKHDAFVERLAVKAEQYRKTHGYEPPYWELVNMAREAKKGK
ncbi:MAG: YiiX/YebB-like N1pC/P60 family cysteine hydrolase [Nitrospirota bacterium]|nr:YiiX/YebB-like N1pC/P60 family cysteine hydrolase [Nitrospirota bacterium]